jgi:hypothetical protein
VQRGASLLGQCQVAKPQTRIAELPFSAINLRRCQPDITKIICDRIRPQASAF